MLIQPAYAARGWAGCFGACVCVSVYRSNGGVCLIWLSNWTLPICIAHEPLVSPAQPTQPSGPAAEIVGDPEFFSMKIPHRFEKPEAIFAAPALPVDIPLLRASAQS